MGTPTPALNVLGLGTAPPVVYHPVMHGNRTPPKILRSLLFVLGALAFMPALAAPSLALATEFPGWSSVADGVRRAEVVDAARPLSRPHAFSCRSPEVFVRTDVTTIEAAVPLVVPFVGAGIGEEVVDADEAHRLSVLSGQGMMFERMLVWLRFDDGVWLLVC